eukprot:7846851-Ditylum_brightwellii.AAC.1
MKRAVSWEIGVGAGGGSCRSYGTEVLADLADGMVLTDFKSETPGLSLILKYCKMQSHYSSKCPSEQWRGQ